MTTTHTGPFANVTVLARTFKVSRQTIYNWTKQPGFPKPLTGTTARNVNEVFTWVQQNKGATNEQD